MTSYAGARKQVTARLILIGAVVAFGLTGCGKSKAPNDASNSPSGTVVSPSSDTNQPHSFAQSTSSEPTGQWQRPPDVTMAGKSVGKIYTEVAQKWNEITFLAANNKHRKYRATFDTDLGPIEITLRPDWAPNHARNFIALCQVGYYDGLVFHRTVNEAVPERAGDKIEIIEAGCPIGTGDPGYGSIGYWLKPEIHADATHEEGTVGACHGDQADTAACKFYINLHKAPFLDGHYTVFGKVTNGLHVARKILSLPVRNDPQHPEGDRPVSPVVIRKVTIHVEETAHQ